MFKFNVRISRDEGVRLRQHIHAAHRSLLDSVVDGPLPADALDEVPIDILQAVHVANHIGVWSDHHMDNWIHNPCTGAYDCMTPLHLHGCLSDKGNCLSPEEHQAVLEMGLYKNRCGDCKRVRQREDEPNKCVCGRTFVGAIAWHEVGQGNFLESDFAEVTRMDARLRANKGQVHA